LKTPSSTVLPDCTSACLVFGCVELASSKTEQPRSGGEMPQSHLEVASLNVAVLRGNRKKGSWFKYRDVLSSATEDVRS